MSAVDAGQRRAHRLLLMVGELHKRGYQELRICPSIAPSGQYWRCVITTADNISRDDGALMVDWHDEGRFATYTSGQENDYFGWGRLQQNARQLADRFEQGFPRLCLAGRGRDWAYAGWYVEMLGLAERGWFPVAFDDTPAMPQPGTVRVVPWAGSAKEAVALPAPPPGRG